MGFIICNIQPLEENRVGIRRVRRLALGGMRGCFARHLPQLAKENDGQWTLSADELIHLDDPGAGKAFGVFFELSSGSGSTRNLLQLIKVSGRTASLITEALFHFKVVGPAEPAGDASEESLVVSDWEHQTECYEQMRLEGGFLGGNWAWGEPPQPLGASVFKPGRGVEERSDAPAPRPIS
jgi:hypothetical protein